MKKTVVLKVNSATPEKSKIQIAARLIRKGGLVAFPTETVYGLGADALNGTAVLQLFKAKKRPLDNPPIVHVSGLQDVKRLTEALPKQAEKLIKMFWPGPLTLILKRSKIVPDETVACLDTIAVRMPRHNVALALISESKCPISAPSANLAGRPSPTTARHVMDDLDGRIDAILDAGPTSIGVESTVVDMTENPPQILRPGGAPFEAIKKVLGDLELNPAVISCTVLPERIRSPGMKHKHYAPKAPMIVVEGETSGVVKKVLELARYYRVRKKKVGILGTDETLHSYSKAVIKSLGSRCDPATIAHNLFARLREFDLENVDVIISESVPPTGIGLAIMNRLYRASGNNILQA